MQGDGEGRSTRWLIRFGVTGRRLHRTFNKSHSVCYAYIAYQTGFLKAHYPAEFMAANLSCNLSQIEKVTVLWTSVSEWA